MMDINEVFESNDFATDMIASKGLEVKKHIFFKLVNGEDNGVSLKNYPHKRLENLVKIYFFEPVPRCQIRITYNHLKHLGMDLQELDAIAQQNSVEQKPAELTNMNGIFLSKERNLLEDDDPLLPDMYVLTNSEKNLGASVICYPDVLAKIGRKLCADFYVLPSSIDEVVILPKFRELSPKRLGKIVREANAEVVAEGHVLSNCAYEYSRKKDTLTIAPGSRERNFKEKGR